jgi:glutamine synthetase
METNLYEFGPEERSRAGIESLPETLGEAIEIGAASELLLRAFGEHTHNRFVEIKRAEWEEYRVQLTPFEMERYLPVL